MTEMKLKGVECTECGSLYTGVHKAGIDANGVRLRRRQCKTCGHLFNTIEIPMEFDFYNTDTMREPERVRVARKSTDYFEITYSKSHTRTNSDKIGAVRAKLVFGKPSDYCYSGRHRFTADNIVMKKGKRTCKACIREREKAYYEVHRDIVNHQRRERTKRKNDSLSGRTTS